MKLASQYRFRSLRSSFVALAVVASGLAAVVIAPPATAAPFDSVCPVVGAEQPATIPMPDNGAVAANSAIGAPFDVAVDTDGSIFYTTGPEGFVMKISPTGVLTRFAGTGAVAAPVIGAQANASPLYAPYHVSIDRARRRLYVDGLNGIVRIDLTPTLFRVLTEME
jgi:streptogramin lyase